MKKFNKIFRLELSTIKLNNKKKNLFNELMKLGSVRIILDSSIDGVSMPREFSLIDNLKIDFSRESYSRDFFVNNFGVSASLNFSSGIYFVRIPWTSVYGMKNINSQKSILFDENTPEIYLIK